MVITVNLDNFKLFEKPLKCNVGISESHLIRTKVSNWLWVNH